MRRYARLPLLLILATFLSGCPAINWYMRQSGRGGVRGFVEGVAELEQPLRGRAYKNVLGDPVLRQTAREITAAIVAGAVDGLTEAKLLKLSEQMAQDSLQTMREQGNAPVNQFVRESGPMLEQVLRRAIESSILTMGEAMRKAAGSDMGAATNLLVQSAVEGMLQALKHSGREAMRDLSNETEQYLTRKVAPNAGVVARTVTREAVLGLQDGFQQSGMHDQLPALRLVMREIGIGLGEGLGQGLGRSVMKSPLEPILIGLSAGLTLLFVATVVWLALLWRRYVQITRDLMKKPATPVSLVTAIDKLP